VRWDRLRSCRQRPRPAAAGTRKEEVAELLTPLLTDADVSMEVAGFAALSLGLVFVGDCHAASAEAILQARAGASRG